MPKKHEGKVENTEFYLNRSVVTLCRLHFHPQVEKLYENDFGVLNMFKVSNWYILTIVTLLPFSAGKTDKTDTQCLEKNGVRCLRVSPDGQLLASGDRQGNIR